MHGCSRTAHTAAWSHAPPPRTHNHTHMDTQASKLQQQYGEGKHTDVVIRVRIGGEAEEEEPQADTRQEEAVDDDGGQRRRATPRLLFLAPPLWRRRKATPQLPLLMPPLLPTPSPPLLTPSRTPTRTSKRTRWCCARCHPTSTGR